MKNKEVGTDHELKNTGENLQIAKSVEEEPENNSEKKNFEEKNQNKEPENKTQNVAQNLIKKEPTPATSLNQNLSDEENNDFTSKESRRIINSIFEENNTQRLPKKESIQVSKNYSLEYHKQPAEFTVQSSSISIGANKTQVVNQTMNSTNTQFLSSQTKKVIPTPSNKIINTSTTTTTKKNEVNQNTTSGDFQSQGYMPFPMSPMGFYYPPGGMNYDPNTMGNNNQVYSMMPMVYYPPGFSYGQTEEDGSKNKKINYPGQNFQNMMPQNVSFYFI